MAEPASTDNDPRPSSDIGKLLAAVRAGGARAALVHAVRVLSFRLVLAPFDRNLDRLIGADTASRVEVEDLDSAGPNRRSSAAYAPSRGRLLSFLLRDVRQDFPRCTFIDVGSGKGRILCAASLLGFRRVIGLELSPSLHREAVRNIRAWLDRADPPCRDISSIEGDATQFEFPQENLVLYLYNPFGPDVLEKMVENLRHSWDRKSRVHLVYYNPVHRDVLDRCGFLRPVRRSATSRLLHSVLSSAEVAIYRMAS